MGEERQQDYLTSIGDLSMLGAELCMAALEGMGKQLLRERAKYLTALGTA